MRIHLRIVFFIYLTCTMCFVLIYILVFCRLCQFESDCVKNLHDIFLMQERLLEAQYKRSIIDNSVGPFWPSFIFGDTLRIVYQNLLQESHEENLQCSERVWRILMQVCPVVLLPNNISRLKTCPHTMINDDSSFKFYRKVKM